MSDGRVKELKKELADKHAAWCSAGDAFKAASLEVDKKFKAYQDAQLALNTYMELMLKIRGER